jgi:hypothetical protein
MSTTDLEAALAYARRGWSVFPVSWDGEKTPLIKWGNGASTNPVEIEKWWRRRPRALIGMPTGQRSGLVVLDVDVKNPRAYGFDTLADLGWGILPVTRMVHTRSDGLHLHFTGPKGVEIRNTVGARGRGIGPGLDWRGTGGFVVLPSPGSGYRWDPVCGIDTPLAEAPKELLPQEPVRIQSGRPPQSVPGLDRYAEVALDKACRAILGAPDGQQEATLNTESFSIGTLAGGGGIPSGFARNVLRWAASQLVSYDPGRPWRASEIEAKVDRAFNDGLRQPRGARHG